MYKKILIPLDGSELAECSLEHAEAIAKGCNVADVILLQVVEPFSLQTMSALGEVDDDTIRRVRQQHHEDANNYLATIQKSLKIQGLSAQTVKVEGRPAEEILTYSEKNKVDLVIMSTHGRSGLSHFFFGSVAEKVSRHSRVPVLLLTPQGCRKVTP